MAARFLHYGLRVLKWTMVAIWVFTGLGLLLGGALVADLVFIGEPAVDRLLGSASAVNDRGDMVTAETERDGAAPYTAKTVIQLRQAYRWFATTPATLLVAESRNYLVGFKWDSDDRLVLRLDFGCHARLTTPVERVGPIRILYRFGNPGHSPTHGYDSFPDDRPRKPCP